MGINVFSQGLQHKLLMLVAMIAVAAVVAVVITLATTARGRKRQFVKKLTFGLALLAAVWLWNSYILQASAPAI